ncbi:DUF6782 family putative metallopeptidase [Salsipaludibacter albus]|uniref:DUF6782 family putative metallopeptidase n=1 Tax=Salsipaludibacter albus TaxID=2849650 RepID=UPI001EE4DE90|nr:DUF6782 family putative metallopeptidase [Salsipaludibacter albus]MBY5163278.1 hypothetical protein [Salsipaludibacter albus]
MATRKQRHQTALDTLTAELKRIVESGDFAAWCTRMARFRTYSPGNRQLIATQRPDATRVASVKTWNSLGRTVIKGERGIVVNVPRPYWVNHAGKRIKPPRDGVFPPGGAHEKIAFGTGYVFDISQTEGDPLDDGPTAPNRAPDDLAAHLFDHCRTEGVAVEYRDGMPPGLSGYWRPATDTITLNAGDSHGDQVATLAHELAHRHDPQLRNALDARDPRYYRHHQADCEAVAEATAHTIAALYGFDLTATSGHYIASWVGNDTDRLAGLADRVGRIVDTICPPHQAATAPTTAAPSAPIARALPPAAPAARAVR